MHRTVLGLGLVTIVFGLMLWGSGFGVNGIVIASTGAALIGFARRMDAQARLMARYDAAHRAWFAGRGDAAEHGLDALERDAEHDTIAPAIAALRVSLHDDAGRHERAREIADTALRALAERGPITRLVAQHEAVHVSALHAARAVAAAHLGDEATLRAELMWVAGEPGAARTARARIYFAATLVAERKGKSPGIRSRRAARKTLAEELERLSPWVAYLSRGDRATVRAWQARVAATHNAYRGGALSEPPPRDSSPPSAMNTSVVNDEDLRPSLIPETSREASDDLARAVAAKQVRFWDRCMRAGMLFAMLSVIYMGGAMINEFGRTWVPEGRHTLADGPPQHPALAFIVIGLAGSMLLVVRARSRAEAQVQRAESWLATAREGDGMRELDRLASAPWLAMRGQGLTARAREREGRGDFKGALADSEAALALPDDVEHHRPRAAFERAMSLAVLGKQKNDVALLAQAAEALRQAEAGARTFAHADEHRFRVGLVLALAEEDNARAVRIASSRPPALPLPYRDDVLADLVCFANDAGAGDPRALLSEIEGSPVTQAWLESVAPEVLRAVRAKGPDRNYRARSASRRPTGEA